MYWSWLYFQLSAEADLGEWLEWLVTPLVWQPISCYYACDLSYFDVILCPSSSQIPRSVGGHMRHRAKFHQNRSHGCKDMAILRFSKRRPSAILDLWNSNVLTIGEVKRTNLHLRTKFRKDRSNHCEDIAILWFFKMAATAIFDFQKFKILTVHPLHGANISHHAKNSSKYGRTVAEIWIFNGFFIMAAVCHLELGPPTITTWWSLSLCQIWLKSIQ